MMGSYNRVDLSQEESDIIVNALENLRESADMELCQEINAIIGHVVFK